MILAKEPNNSEVLNFKFNVLNNDIRDEQRAFQSLKDYADASNDVNAFIMLASKYADSGNNEQATLYYERALASRPDANTYKAGKFLSPDYSMGKVK
jgi:tetratricopeptide (TPR) repeat protein